MAELFGFKITKANQGGGSDGFTAPSTDDGTLDVYQVVDIMRPSLIWMVVKEMK